jgi:molecular chaperone GrpE
MNKKKTEKVDYKKLSERLAKEVEEIHNALLRERADATNIRKRAEDEKLKLGGYYKSLVIKALLPTIDNFDRALKSVPKELEDNDYIKGIEGIMKQFAKTLSTLGVERIETVGEPFNPELHEAVTMEEGDGTKETVSEELQSGYTMNGEVLRHAMVRVKS